MRHRILLTHITVNSGHYRAARAIEHSIRELNPKAEILNIDAFQYLNPFLARLIDRMYLSVIKKAPEVWDYLYDNPKVVRRSQQIRELLHRYDSPRLQALMRDFNPDVVACTQAFPCGLVSDYKREHTKNIPLYGILTDFSPHAYWVHDQVDGYVVPAETTKHWLVDHKIDPKKISVFGIPIDPLFGHTPDWLSIRRRLQLDPHLPTLLMMGGGQGLGPLVEAVDDLDKISAPFQLLVVTGSNESLYHRLIKRAPSLKHPVRIFAHVDFIADLMSVSSLIITKPGGLTTSEALVKGLPIVALNPIPGQEMRNANFLVSQKAGLLVKKTDHLATVVRKLLHHPDDLKTMAQHARRLGKPHAAADTARLVLGL